MDSSRTVSSALESWTSTANFSNPIGSSLTKWSILPIHCLGEILQGIYNWSRSQYSQHQPGEDATIFQGS